MRVRAMAYYSFDPGTEPAMPILKSSKFIPDAIPLLCKQFGENWRDEEDLHWYKGILDSEGERTDEHNVLDDERVNTPTGVLSETFPALQVFYCPRSHGQVFPSCMALSTMDRRCKMIALVFLFNRRPKNRRNSGLGASYVTEKE
ncbi:hypothetical protein PR048_002725 [Dryococelus australis]|uniref:Uncharacterized protein n=1 Tax=Dryococelus australis TaxID=614101 RepID=A0ABQ9IL10_9NEOP|nr:hypothetical protein PR048_002725 [Dryococelus australis]